MLFMSEGICKQVWNKDSLGAKNSITFQNKAHEEQAGAWIEHNPMYAQSRVNDTGREPGPRQGSQACAILSHLCKRWQSSYTVIYVVLDHKAVKT